MPHSDLSPIRAAATKGNIDAVKKLIQNNANLGIAKVNVKILIVSLHACMQILSKNI